MRYKLAEWLEKEHDTGSYVKMEIAHILCNKWKQMNEDTEIVKWDRCLEICIPQIDSMPDLYPEPEYETKTIRKEVMAKEYRTFPFIAPYSKPKKTWIEKEVKESTNIEPFRNDRTIKMEDFFCQDRGLIFYINAGYDPMKDVLYINCEVSKCGINLP